MIKPFKEFERVHDNKIFDINWCPKETLDNYLLTAGADNKVVIWNLEGGKVQVLPHPNIVSSAVFDVKRSTRMATGCFDMCIRVWNTSKRTVMSFQRTPGKITALQMSNSGHRLVAGLQNGEIHVYEMNGD